MNQQVLSSNYQGGAVAYVSGSHRYTNLNSEWTLLRNL